MWSPISGIIILLLPFLTEANPQSLPALSPPIQVYRSTPSGIMATRCDKSSQCSSQFPHTDCRSRAFCQCQQGYIEEYDKCLPVIMDLESDCQINAQCERGMGPLSRCNPSSNLCECYDTEGNGRNSTVFGSQRCYFWKTLGDRCDLNEECRASISPEKAVRCDVWLRRCVCDEGEVCRNVQKPVVVKVPHSIARISCNDLGECYSVRDPIPLRYSGGVIQQIHSALIWMVLFLNLL